MDWLFAHQGLGRRVRNTRRVREVVGVAARYGFADPLRAVLGRRLSRWRQGSTPQDVAQQSAAVRFRLALAELSTTFIKFGQMLSTRADLVGEEVAGELARLQNDTAPDSPGVAEATIEAELGAAPATLFASFDPVPFASASIAQVHYARLHSGERVVVKVQRQGIGARIDTDLSILADLAELAERHIGDARRYHPVAVVRQFTKTMTGELDFRRELRNMQRFRANFAGEPHVRFPAPFPEFSTRRVLTMERLEGVLVSQMKRRTAPEDELLEFARRGARVYLDMIFRDGFYHADPHPGNLMLLPGEVVGVLDCGMVQRLDDDLREWIEDLLGGVVHGDATAVTTALAELSTSSPVLGRQRLAFDVAELLDDFAEQAVGGAGGDIGVLVGGLMQVVHRHHLMLPPGASLLLRMLAVLEGTVRLLHPSFSLVEVVEPYAAAAVRRRYTPGHVWRELQGGAREWQRLLRSLPGDLNEMVRRTRAGTLSVHLEHRRLDPVVNRLVLGLLTSSLLLGSSLLWSMHAPPLVGGVSLFGAIGYVLALVMGLSLWRRAKRSEEPQD